MTDSFDPRTTYVHLKASGAAPVEAGPQFWADLSDGRCAYPGRLAMILPMVDDFPHWERHPQGEELIIMLAGVCLLIVETDAGDVRTRLEAGQAVLVPAGAWHRAEVLEPGEALFVTEGEASEHRQL